MANHTIYPHCCEDMKMRVEDPNVAIEFFDRFREYGISLVGSSGVVRIDFCPWCNNKLPTSLRNRYYDELENIGIDDPYSQDVPDDFKSAEWYINRNIT